MNTVKRNEETKKKGPIKDVLNKFKYSFKGLSYCFKNETSFIFETIAIVAAIIFGIYFRIEPLQWLFSLGSIFLIMAIEALNTAIECVVDMVCPEYNPLAGAAKDCGSAATCICTFLAAAANAVVFIPYIIALFK